MGRKLSLTRKTTVIHGGREVSILSPVDPCPLIIAAEFKGNNYTFSNSIGYAMLRDLFMISCGLGENEIIHMPIVFEHSEEFLRDYPEPDNLFNSLIFRNYCTCRLKTKDILASIKAQSNKQDFSVCCDDFIKNDVDHWKTRRRLTIKTAGKHMLLSANRDVFTELAQSCDYLAELEDDEKMNHMAPHFHHDWMENTARSGGITFYYWTPPLCKKELLSQ